MKLVLAFLILMIACSNVLAQNTGFTYQGKLNDNGTPANGNYLFQFKLYDAAASGTGNQIGATLANVPATVTNGIFAVTLDFGTQAFDGNPRFMEIGVRLNDGGSGAFTLLTPRQPLTATPYAIRSLTANQATTATDATNLAGVPATQYVKTDDTRMTDARTPLPGSTAYVQNSINSQADANFNIGGIGKALQLHANAVNAKEQYQLNGARVLQFDAKRSGYVGLSAGPTATGDDNMFVGFEAGKATTTGGYNSFFGSQTGKANTTGLNNSFFGAYAGSANTTGNANAFFGGNTGLGNTTGSSNAFFGSAAGVANTVGSENAFFGTSSGQKNITGNANAFFGTMAGRDVTTGANNTMIGARAGWLTSSAGGNSFVGAFAGEKNTNGHSNSFFGLRAGKDNQTGNYNVAVGYEAGTGNFTGHNNVFIGTNSSGTGSNNIAIGSQAKSNGTNNTAIGTNASVIGNITNATAIGANAVANDNNQIMLGTQNDLVRVPGNVVGEGNATFTKVTASSMKVQYGMMVGKTEIGNDVKTSGVVAKSGEFEQEVTTQLLGVKLTTVGTTPVCVTDANPNWPHRYIANCSSSMRYKHQIQNFMGGLNMLQRLRPVTFVWNTSGTKDVGFVAEEINAVEPLLSTYNDQGQIEGVKYAQITTILVNAVKEQQTQIQQQQAQIHTLQKQLRQMNKTRRNAR